jgi:hypothetical protein
MTPITATAREQVKTLLCILKAPKLSAQRRKAAEDAMAIWIERAHKAGAPSLGVWMDGPTSTTDAGSFIAARYAARNAGQQA